MASNLKDIGDIKDELKPIGKKVRILLEENDEIPPSGQFIGVNGAGFLLKPGVEVDVPDSIIEVLNNAVKSKPVIDPETRRIVDWRNALRFPYRVIRT